MRKDAKLIIPCIDQFEPRILRIERIFAWDDYMEWRDGKQEKSKATACLNTRFSPFPDGRACFAYRLSPRNIFKGSGSERAGGERVGGSFLAARPLKYANTFEVKKSSAGCFDPEFGR